MAEDNETMERADGPVEVNQAGERERSTIQFPYMNLDDAMEVIEAVHSHVGHGVCSEDQLAAWLKLSSKSSGFRLRIGTSKMFGLIEGSSTDLKLTDLGKLAVDSKTSAKAKAQAFLKVPLYDRAYRSYKGGVVPPAVAFEKDINSWGVALKQTGRARAVLEKSADIAGFYHTGRDRLVLPAAVSFEGKSDETNGTNGNTAPLPPNPPQSPKNDAPAHHPFIEGLLKSLPREGETWPQSKRVQWLTLAANAFDLIFEGESQIEIKGKSET